MNTVARDVKVADEIKATQATSQEFANAVEDDKVKGRIRAEVERNDAEVYARIEALKKARDAARARVPVEPLEPVPARVVSRRAATSIQSAPAIPRKRAGR